MSARAMSAVLVMAAIILFVGCSQENSAETAATGGTGANSASATEYRTGGANVAALPKPRPAPTAELPDPVVTMHTSLGDVMIRLNQKAAPRTVSNFVDYVLTKHYDGTIIHQIDAGYALIGGSFTEKLVQKPVRYPIPNESTNGLKNRRGTIAMFRNPADPHSATSQYFINLADNPKLDRSGDKPEEAGYCVFGEVIQGLDVLEKISQVRTADVKGFTKLPTQTVLVQSMSVVR